MEDRGTHLSRRLSTINVLALALGCIVGWGAFVLPGDSFLPKGGTLGTGIGLFIATVVMIVIACNYHYMITRIPEAGGEFTYAKDAFGRTHGFICAWFLILSYGVLVPFNSTGLALVARTLLGNLLQWGFHYQVAGYEIYMGELFIALSAIVLFAFLGIRGVKTSGIFQTILTFCIVGGVGIIAAAALLDPRATLSNLSPGFNPGTGKLPGVLSILAVAPFLFVGFDTIPQSAEEFNFSHKKSFGIMVGAILFGGILYLTLNTVTACVTPQGYDNYTLYIQDLPNLHGIAAFPTFYAAYTLLGVPGLVAIGIAVTGAILSGINGFYMAASRLLYALGREKIVPRWFSSLSSKRKTPKNAYLFIMAISLIGPFFGRTALGWLVDMSSIGAAIGYGYTSAAAFRQSRIEKNVRIQVTAFLGCVFSIIFSILLLIPIPIFNCSLGKESYFCLVIWGILGIAFYWPKLRNNG